MSDSSSSDNDDDGRFKEACDPTLSVSYGNENRGELARTCEPSGIETDSGTIKAAIDTRASILLVEKVKKCMVTLQKTKIGGARVPSCGKCRVIPKTELININTPSTLAPYLAKQLTMILDKRVELRCEPEAAITQKPGGSQSSMCLLRGVHFEGERKDEESGQRRRRAAAKARKKNTYFDSSDEDEVVSRCGSLALSPDWLIHNTCTTPPHPKNTRYLEEYVVKKRHSDGTIVASVKEDAAKGKRVVLPSLGVEQQIKGAQQIYDSRRIQHTSKKHRTSELGVVTETEMLKNERREMNGKVDNISQLSDVGKVTGDSTGDGNNSNVRKQSRKRGKKKAKNDFTK